MRKYIIGIIVLGTLELALALYLSFWRHVFWDVVADKQAAMFAYQLAVFGIVACVLCVVSAWSSYLVQLASINWREVLNAKALLKQTHKVDNCNQRIQQDCADYPQLMLSILTGFGKACMYVLVFSVSLILNYSWLYLILITIYAIISTIVAKKIAKPLIGMNYRQQQVEATYRNNLEEINFGRCVTMMLKIAKKTKTLQYFQILYSQIGVVLPIMIVAPAYFLGSMTLGALMQATSTMGTISDNLSFGITSFGDINRLLSCRLRLKEMGVI